MAGTGWLPGWRQLGLFWAVIVLSAGSSLITLEVLGPPVPPTSAVQTQGEHDNSSSLATPKPSVTASDPTPAKISAPLAALLEPSSGLPDYKLPRIAADGRMARIVYAAPAPAVTGMPRVALMLSSFGLSERDSQAALDQLPAPVSLAVSAYADAPALLAAARERGHELLASIPMEPQGYPLNDEGTRSLNTGLSPKDNTANLEWALSRTQGAVGATGASDGMRGERFADIASLFNPMLDEVTRRGLLYVDARPGRVSSFGTPVRAVDVVLDDQLGRAEIEAKLLSLERTARERGSAIGLVGSLRPTTIERIAAWTKTLQDHGLTLVPVSALVNP